MAAERCGRVVRRPGTVAGLACAAIALASPHATADPAAGGACPPDATDVHAVAAVPTATTFVLGDGTEVRLAGVLAPSARDLPAAVTDWPLAEAARREMERLLSTRRLRLSGAAAFQDRYGRRVAHAAAEAEEPSGRVWLQAALVEAGFARVAPLPGETLCLARLLKREAVARATRIGLWSNPAYAIRNTRETRTLNKLIGTFQIVEGWVAATGATRSEAFLNFGRDWRWDFTAAVDLRRVPEREALLARLKRLEGRQVRVRGWIERRNGPFITLATADAIEELPEGLAAGP